MESPDAVLRPSTSLHRGFSRWSTQALALVPLAALLEGAQGAPNEAFAGKASCPCISPPRLQQFIQRPDGSQKDCLIYNGTGDNGKLIRHCLPPDYGMDQCKAWMFSSHPSCVKGSMSGWDLWLPDTEHSQEPLDICGQPWCYIDPQNCDQKYAKSDMFGETCQGGCTLEANAYYSYSTCGGNELGWKKYASQKRHLHSILNAGKLRVSMPNYAPYTMDCKAPTVEADPCQDQHSSCESWKTAESCSGAMQILCPMTCGECAPKELSPVPPCPDGGLLGKTGYSVQLFNAILEKIEVQPEMGLPAKRIQHANGTLELRGTARSIAFELVSLRPETQKEYGTWTGTVMDLAADHIDLSISGFWDDPGKRAGALLVGPILNDYFRLVATFSVTQYGLQDMLLVFTPVSWEVWGLLLIVTIIIGPLMYFLEEGHEGEEGEDEGDFTGKDSSSWIRGSCLGVWHGMLSIFGAAPTFSPPSSWLGRWLMLGYAFFVMVFVAGYTANMTNFLIQRTSLESITSMDDLLEQDKTACVWSGGSLKKVKFLFPDSNDKSVVENDEVMGNWQFDSGSDSSECHGLITANADADHFINSPNDQGVMEHCDKHAVGDPLLPINVVWLVNPRFLEVADALSFYISELVDQVKADKIRKEHFASGACTDALKRKAVQLRAEKVAEKQAADRCLKGGGGGSSSSGAGKGGNSEMGEDEEGETNQTLGVEELSGLFIVMGFFITITAVLFAVKKLKKWRAASSIDETPKLKHSVCQEDLSAIEDTPYQTREERILDRVEQVYDCLGDILGRLDLIDRLDRDACLHPTASQEALLVSPSMCTPSMAENEIAPAEGPNGSTDAPPAHKCSGLQSQIVSNKEDPLPGSVVTLDDRSKSGDCIVTVNPSPLASPKSSAKGSPRKSTGGELASRDLLRRSNSMSLATIDDERGDGRPGSRGLMNRSASLQTLTGLHSRLLAMEQSQAQLLQLMHGIATSLRKREEWEVAHDKTAVKGLSEEAQLRDIARVCAELPLPPAGSEPCASGTASADGT